MTWFHFSLREEDIINVCACLVLNVPIVQLLYAVANWWVVSIVMNVYSDDDLANNLKESVGITMSDVSVNISALWFRYDDRMPIMSPSCLDNDHVGVRTFQFMSVHDGPTTQENIYEDCCKEMVTATLNGYNSSVLCYGQTGVPRIVRFLIAIACNQLKDNSGLTHH